MPISVKCAQCGQVSAAPDSMAGRSAKCPKCPAILNIPAAAAPATLQPLARPTAPAAAAPPPLAPFASAPAAPPPNSASNLFDEAGMGTRAAGTFPCPSCSSSLPPHAVLCVKCGFNLKTGQQLQTRRDLSAGPAMGTSGDGHADATLILLDRAREAIEDAKIDEKKKTSEGLPWWVHLINLLLAIGFLVMMSTLPAALAVFVAGILLALIGFGFSVFLYVMIIKTAFDDSTAKGLMTIFIPPYLGYYTYENWDKCGSYSIYHIIGDNVLTLGVLIAIYGPPFFLPGEGQQRSQHVQHSMSVVRTF